MSWKVSVEITKGDNGWKLGWWEETDDGLDHVWHEEYIQDDEGDRLKSGIELLWWVLEYFSLGGSKHDPERIRIVREGREK